MNKLKSAYKNKANEVKSSASKDKGVFIESIVGEAEKAAQRGAMSTVYMITKQLSGNNSNGSTSRTDQKCKCSNNGGTKAKGWVEHLEQILNRSEPDSRADSEQADEDLPINTNMP